LHKQRSTDSFRPCLFQRSSFAVGLVFILYLCFPGWAPARQDTALLSFQKILPAEQVGKTYTVRRGDSLYTIIRNTLGIRSAKARKETMDLIKKLNPNLTDPGKIFPGQSIVLPEKQFTPEKDVFGVEIVFYKVKRGDSLEKILMSQLNVKRADMTEMLRNIKEMNPKLTNPDHIVVNQMIRLPASGPSVETENGDWAPEGDEGEIDPDKPVVISETLMRNMILAGKIINTLDGSLIMDGQYYLPLTESGQITIDCASIPVVEFEDGSFVFIALKSRLPNQAKEMIQANWPNYRFTAVNEKDSLVSILQKVINQSGSYRMKKGGRYVIGDRLSIQISPNWTIQRNQQQADTKTTTANRGLLVYRDASHSLPAYLLKRLSERGVDLTEVVPDTGILSGKKEDASLQDVPDISGTSKVDMIHNLLVLLGQDADKDVELSLFNQSKGGFNLTMRADILLKRENRQALLSFGTIPPEFEKMLKHGGYEILPMSESDSKIKLVTKILDYLNITCSFSYFRLTVNHTDDPDSPFISAVFPALQIYRPDRFLYYLVDFPFDPAFYSYFKQLKEVNIIRY